MLTAEQARAMRSREPITLDEVLAEIEAVAMDASMIGSGDLNYRILPDEIEMALTKLGYRVERLNLSDRAWRVCWA